MNDTERKEFLRKRQRGYEIRYRRRKRKENPAYGQVPFEIRYARNPEGFKRRVKNWRAKNKEKYRAHQRVYYALKTGKLVKPSVCSQCGGDGDGHIEGHHPDYSKPLEVIWLCHLCHGKVTEVVTD